VKNPASFEGEKINIGPDRSGAGAFSFGAMQIARRQAPVALFHRVAGGLCREITGAWAGVLRPALVIGRAPGARGPTASPRRVFLAVLASTELRSPIIF